MVRQPETSRSTCLLDSPCLPVQLQVCLCQAKFTFAKLDCTQKFSKEDLDVYMRRFNEKAPELLWFNRQRGVC